MLVSQGADEIMKLCGPGVYCNRSSRPSASPPSPSASAPSDRAELPEAGRQYRSKWYLPVFCIGQVCRFRLLRCRQLRFALFYKEFCFCQVRLVED